MRADRRRELASALRAGLEDEFSDGGFTVQGLLEPLIQGSGKSAASTKLRAMLRRHSDKTTSHAFVRVRPTAARQ
jgi:hypothetical protein